MEIWKLESIYEMKTVWQFLSKSSIQRTKNEAIEQMFIESLIDSSYLDY